MGVSWPGRCPSPWSILAMSIALKLLLAPAYRSTDFEVHRNWLAITHSLPLSQWYIEATSEWTLDYPPLFAWFEWALSQAAAILADPAMLRVDNLGYASPTTVTFQRGSVVLTELALLAVAWRVAAPAGRGAQVAALAAVALHPGLIIVDHIHFQYNGILLGLFIASLEAGRRGRPLICAALFAVLLNMKHIFLYAAPAYFVFLLRSYCTGPSAVTRFLQLAGVVGCVFAVALGPFLATGQGPALLSRLFPVGRGLLHAYWAPNAWALYAAADKALGLVLRGTPLAPGLGLGATPTASLTGGLVGTASFQLLPDVGPRGAALATLLAMLPCLLCLWRKPLPSRFPAAVLYCTLASFFFGYHVHEKAILMVIVPLGVFALADWSRADLARFAFLSTLGTYSLLPLLHRPEEYAIKVLLLALYTWIALGLLRGDPGDQGSLLTLRQRCYLWGLVPLEVLGSLVLPSMPKVMSRLPFLPLALVSAYCALGVGAALVDMARAYVPSGKDKGE